MYHPTSRVLAVLELLQAKPSITGPELAARLEMDVRTVRRYITHLQDVGIPVESNIGRHGGYRLRPGFKLPPLLFTEEEATAIILGLLGTSWLEIGQSAVAIEGALAKVSRVLPMKAKERLEAISQHMFFFADEQDNKPEVAQLIQLSEAIGQELRLSMRYLSGRNEGTQRTVEPYGVIGWEGRWYLVAYCCLRKGFRTFRLDRMQDIKILNETFVREKDFDCRAYVQRYANQRNQGKRIVVEFQAELYLVQQKMSKYYGELVESEKGVLFTTHAQNMERVGRYLMSLNLPFIIHNPPELKEAFVQLAEQMLQIAKV